MTHNPAGNLQPPELTRHCWYLTGATASGKSRVGLELAQRLNAEIISLDSMALYRGMNIGTAKPAAAEQQQCRHHMLDTIEPTEEYAVTQYLDEVTQVIADIRSRHKQPLFVGGTALYLKSLLRGVFEGPPADWDFRREVEAEVEQVGLEALHQRLEQVDPLSAVKLHVNDKRRIIRALEVYKVTGQPISHLQTQFDEGLPAEQCRVFALRWPRPVLHERINARVEAMFQAGLIEEVRGLLAQHGELSRTARQAVGYRETIAHLQGEHDLATTIDRVQASTRQFARRQEIWFRGLSECRFIELSADDSPSLVAQQIESLGQ
jgi:tRNA dimethylallyltransferase